MTPARGAETNGENRNEPRVTFGQNAKHTEQSDPDYHKEKQNQEHNRPFWCVLAGPEIEPVASVRSREEVVLNEDAVEEPLEEYISLVPLR